MSAGRPVKSLDPALDIVRLLAALLVAVGHLRALAIPDMDPSWGFFAKLAYATTTLGHAAVMVFFVLSGYLVGGKVIDDTIQGTFSWTVYLISRYVRLAIVLVPAVVMTVILDQAGMWIFETGNYSDGGVVDNRTSLVALLGNLAFLQGNLVEPLGSNGPLWSVAFEMSYYLMFPTAVRLLVARKWSSRSALTCFLALLIWVSGPNAIALFPVWLLGASVHLNGERLKSWGAGLSRRMLMLWWSTSIVGLAGFAVLDKLQGGNPSLATPGGYATGLVASIVIALLVARSERGESWRSRPSRIAVWCAQRTYTIYAVHLPIGMFLAGLIGAAGMERENLIVASEWLLLVALAGFTLPISIGVASITEMKHQYARRYILDRLERSRFRHGLNAEVRVLEHEERCGVGTSRFGRR